MYFSLHCRSTSPPRAYFNMQLITICAVVKLKCAVVKVNLCSCKMCSCWHKIKIFINNIVVDKLLFKNFQLLAFGYLLTGSNNSYYCLALSEMYSMLLNATPLFRLEVVGPLMTLYKSSLCWFSVRFEIK